MNDASPSPPGWYPDPAGSGSRRWWNGQTWSAATVPPWPDGHEPPPPPQPWSVAGTASAPSTPTPPPGADPGRRRLEIVTLVAAVAVFLTSFVALGVRNSARDDRAVGEVAPQASVPEPRTRAEIAAARDEAGCELLVDGDPLEDRTHVEPEEAPPPEVLYPDHRPAHSGRHYPRWLPLTGDVAEQPIDERAVVHNLEHGSVVVWFDGRQVDGATADRLADWKHSRDDLGFTSEVAGGIFVSPAPVIASGKPIALRAWGVAMDCERFDPLVADGFLIEHWGSHGASPEAHLSPYPDGSLRYADRS